MKIQGKTVSIDIEVDDAHLDYNLLFGDSWFCTMTSITSLFFSLLQFPHQGKHVTIDQLDYCTPNIHNNNANNIPLLGEFNVEYENVGVGLLKDSSLMGAFPFRAPDRPHIIAVIYMISAMVKRSLESIDP
jgi:hypothetical protein